MATGSTKSGRKPRQHAPAGAPRGVWSQANEATPTPAEAERDAGVSRRTWLVASAAIMLVAFVFRAVALELRPMHHDEGVNGHFLLGLLRSGAYRYDPSNYHGPTLYYFTLPLAYAAQKAEALSTWVVRLVPLVFGVATVWLALAFRRYVGRVGALSAAALMAVSPGMVFFSRYFIHEMMFVFFTVAAVVAALKFYEAGAEREARAGGGDASDEARPAGAAAGDAAGAAFGGGAAAASVLLAASSLWLASNPAQLKLGLAAVGFAFAATVALLWSYDGARSIYLILGAISAALLFATKETAFISVGVILIAWASALFAVRFPVLTRLALIWAILAVALMVALRQFAADSAMPLTRLVASALLAVPLAWGAGRLLKLTGKREPPAQKSKRGRERRAAQAAEDSRPQPLHVIGRLGGWARVALLAVVSLGLFLFVNVLYYSSFFTNPKGVGDAVEAYKIWKKTGESGFHGYRWHKYIQWLVGDWNTWQFRDLSAWQFGEEPLLVALAGIGLLLALWRARRRFPVFAALWGFGLLAAYSIIRYKTPWLVLSMLPPFALAAGYTLNLLYHRRGWRAPAVALLAVAVAVAAYQSYNLNFVYYDDDRYPYVYAHTKRQFLDLVAQIERVAERTGNKYNASLNVAAENQEYWPLPWYVRDYKRVGFIGRVTQTSDDMVLIKDKQIPELEAALGSRYRRVGEAYDLRPGVKLVLYARRDLAF